MSISAKNPLLRHGVAMLLAVAVLALATALAFAHSERPTAAPPRPGPWPDLNRTPMHVLDVCKPPAVCPYQDIQAAVNAALPDTEIRVHRGLYKELPSRAVLDDIPPDGSDGTYSFMFHQCHPNNINLIAVLGGTSVVCPDTMSPGQAGKFNLTIAGWDERTNTYANPRDVVIDVEFQKHVGIRCDKADGCILRNLTVYHAREHNFYVLDLDRWITDHTVSGYAGDYPYLTFANDHGIQSAVEAFGGGDGGIYPGGQADLDQLCDPIQGCDFSSRAADNYVCNGPGDPLTCCTGAGAGTCWHSVEVAHSKSYHNVLGYSGTQGDWALVHDTEFFDNAIGFVDDSETDHPNYPQNSVRFERNYVYDNNFNVYREDSDITITVFFGSLYLPVGTGVFWASGNANQTHNNYIWDNNVVGVWTASGEGIVIGPTSDPPAAPFMSSCNRHTLNKMYRAPGFEGMCTEPDCANALDFSWDGLGNDNCWENNDGTGPAPDDATMDFTPVACTGIPDPVTGCNVALGIGNPATNGLSQLGLTYVEGEPLCVSLGTQPCFIDPGQTQGNPAGRNRIGGCIAAEDPLTPLKARGRGRVQLSAGEGRFRFNARRTASTTRGSFRVIAPGLSVKGRISGLHRNALVGTIDGPCTLNDVTAVCQFVFEDKAVPGAGVDTLSVSAAPMVGAPFILQTSTIFLGDISLSDRTLEPCDAT